MLEMLRTQRSLYTFTAMKRAYLLPAGILVLVAPTMLHSIRLAGMQAPVASTTVSGTVLRTGTSEPIPDVQVSLSTSGVTLAALRQTVDNAISLGIAVPPVIQTQLETLEAAERRGGNTAIEMHTTTDRSGRFTFQAVPPGQYTVMAEREGYFGTALTPFATGTPPAFIQTNVTVTQGQIPASISLSMSPGNAISGTVVDSDGRPVVGAQVQAYRINFQNGNAVLQTVTNSVTTDDRGAYRVFRIPPGDYYLDVTPAGARGARGFSGVLGARAAAPPKQGLVRTFYPDAREAKNARVISLRGGEDLTGAAIAVQSSPFITVSGQVVSAMPIPAITGPRGNLVTQTVTLLLLPRDKNAIDTTNVRQVGNATMDGPSNGQFQLTGIVPGSYDLYARVTNANNATANANNPPTEPNFYFGRTMLEAGFNDVDGLTLTINRGVELKAFATVDGSASAAAGNVRLNIQSLDSARFLPGYIRNVNQASDAEGAITVPFVSEGLYRLQATLSPSLARTPPPGRGRGAAAQQRNAYVDDIREGGVSVYDNGLLVGQQSPRPIEIIIKTNGGIVEGDVYDARQQLKPNAAVVLVPPDARRHNPALYKTATTDAMGHFIMPAVAPGQYKVFAWESISNAQYLDPAFLQKFEERGRSIIVNASNTTTTQVPLISD